MKNKETEEKENKSGGKNITFASMPVIAYSALIVLAVLAIVFVGMAYLSSGMAGTAIGRIVSKVVPLPAAVLNYTNFISMQETESDMQALQSFYENQDFSSVGMRVDFSTDDGAKRLQIKKKQLLNKLIEDRVVLLLAEKRGITVSQSDVDAKVDAKLAEYDTRDDVVASLKKLYGWTLDDFKAKVVLPDAYKEALFKEIEGELKLQQENAGSKIEKAREDLQKGKDFTEVVKTYSEGSSAANGGELGWVKKGQLMPQLAEKVFTFNHNKEEIIETDLGFHLVDVEDVKKEDGEDVIRIRQVFVKKVTFADWLTSQMRLMSIKIPLKGFYWDESTLGVEFSDERMREFERQEKENSDGDASIFF